MNTIIHWLEHLKVLMPPKHISLVGAGNGKGTWARWLAHQTESRVTFVEADTLQCATLQRTLESLGQRAQCCEVLNTVVAAQPGMTSFLVASNQQESGLLEPRSLLSLWPNLQTEEVKELSAITLDALLGDLSEDVEQPMDERHWLVIDCLPARVLLRASSKLDLVDVVIARVLLGEMHAMPDGTSLEQVAEFLQQKGMVQIAVEATRHPGIGYALFVRDARAALRVHYSECQKLRLIGEEQVKLLQEFQAQVWQLTQTKAAAEKRSQELALQLEQLSQALEKQSRLAQECLSQTEQLTQAKAAAEKQSQDRAQQLEQLTKARDEQAKLAQERHAQIEQLTQAKAAAEKQSQERALQLEQLGKARDEQAKLAQERQAQIGQLTQAKASAEKQSQELGQQLEQLNKAVAEQARLLQEKKVEGKIGGGVSNFSNEDLAHSILKLKSQNEEILNFKCNSIKYFDELIARSDALDKSIKDNVNNASKQIEAFIGLQSYFNESDLPIINIERHGWPVSPDFAFTLVGLIEKNNYDLIIEFGSGISTGIIARALKKIANKRRKKTSTDFFSFEHLEEFFFKTRSQLKDSRVDNYVSLIHSPLKNYISDDGGTYPYYDCQKILADISIKYNDLKPRILVVVDGPPGSTGKNARYPAAPLVLKNFHNAYVDILLDDYIREDEKDIAKKWKKELDENKRKYSTMNFQLEKDALLISISS